MGSLLRTCRQFVNKYPFPFQMVSTGLLMSTGDLIAQTIVEREPIRNINYVRTCQYFAVGAFAIGPALSTWYRYLHFKMGSGGKTVTIKKVLVDQIFFAPICIAGFLLVINAVQMRTFEETKELLKENYVDILISNYKIWPCVQLFNFYLVPLHYQVIVVQIVAVFWNAYLSHKTSSKQH